MSTRQYIGARYVPKFFDFGGSAEWRSGVAYEALTIVTRNGNSYTSKIPVPSNIGEPENNPEYWVSTGLYNEQVESIRQAAINAQDDVDALETRVDDDVTALDARIDENTQDITELDNRENVLTGMYGQTTSSKRGAIGAFEKGSDAIQGCYSVGNTLYVYKTNGANGAFKTINMITGAMSAYGNTVGYYHGNDFCVKNNKLYCAPYDNGSTGINRIIVGTTDGSAVTEEIDCFSGLGLDCLYGITDYEGDEILCALRPYGNLYDVTQTRLFAFNVITREIREIFINWNGFYYALNQFPHPIHYIDGVLYLTTSFENGIYSLIIEGNGATVSRYVGLDPLNTYNEPMGEIEGACTVETFGKNILVIYSVTGEGDVIIDGVGLRGENPNSFFNTAFQINSTFRQVYYDPSSTTAFEDGTPDRPFKAIRRALYACTSKAISPFEAVNLHLPAQVTENITLYNGNFGFANAATINGNVTVTRAKLAVAANTIFNGTVEARYGGEITGEGCTFNSTLTASRGKLYFGVSSYHNVVLHGSEARIALRDATADISGSADGDSVVQFNRSKPTSFSTGGGVTVLTPGVK